MWYDPLGSIKRQNFSFNKSNIHLSEPMNRTDPSETRTTSKNDSPTNFLFSETTTPYHPPLPVGNGITSISVEETSVPNPSVSGNTNSSVNIHATQETTATTRNAPVPVYWGVVLVVNP
ncbi:unnamed protein product [Rotaria socialis]